MLRTVKIQSVVGGWSPAQYLAREGQFLSSLGIDPDMPISTSDTRTSGVAVPVCYAKFSSTTVTASPIVIVTDPKNTLTYVVLSNGRIVTYNSSFASETLVGTVAGGVANGAAYYNDYIYVTTGTDVSRYGPLSGVPALTDNYWTSTLSLAALANTTFPTFRSVSVPNHWMFVAGNNELYFANFASGQGQLNKIVTTSTGTNNGSAANVLDLPFGYYIADIDQMNTDVAIIAFQTTDTTVQQGAAALFLWDTTSDTFYRQVNLPDPIATAVQNVNGTLYVFSGNAQKGCRVSRYAGGETVQDVAYLEESNPPLAGAVSAIGNRVVWGAWVTNPAACSTVFALGSKSSDIPMGLHSIIRTSSTGANPLVTSIYPVQQTSNITPQFVVGWKDDSGYGLDSRSTSGTLSAVLRLPLVSIGMPFRIIRVRIPLAGAVDASTTVTPTMYIDDASSNTVLSTVNNTNFPSRRKIVYKAPGLASLGGSNNFYLQLAWTGTTQIPMLLPVEFDVDVYEDELP